MLLNHRAKSTILVTKVVDFGLPSFKSGETFSIVLSADETAITVGHESMGILKNITPPYSAYDRVSIMG